MQRQFLEELPKLMVFQRKQLMHFFFFFLAVWHSLWGLSSLIWDQTQAHVSASNMS